MLVLIDKPFVSDFLIDTLRRNGYALVSTPEARQLVGDSTLNWMAEEEAARFILENPQIPLYTNSENALSWIHQHAPESEWSRNIQYFKDKARFRELVGSFQEGVDYRTASRKELLNMPLPPLPFPFVVKPSVGFFSLGVHIINGDSDWQRMRKELSQEAMEGVFPESVLDASTFLLEEYIHGEEFAVDCYYNDRGQALVLNILHHRFATGMDTSDRVYTTSRDIVQRYLRPFGDFLDRLGQAAGIRNFPAHVELRMDDSGRIQPIEVNPLRFGGFCTTADLPGIALSYNLYEHYARHLEPDWEKIFRGKEDKLFSIMVLNNNSGIPPEEIRKFDYELLKQDFEKPLEVRSLDIRQYPLFGFLFAESRPENEAELQHILHSDLKKYIS